MGRALRRRFKRILVRRLEAITITLFLSIKASPCKSPAAWLGVGPRVHFRTIHDCHVKLAAGWRHSTDNWPPGFCQRIFHKIMLIVSVIHARDAVACNIPVQNTLSVRTFQHTMFTQQKHSGTKYSVSTNIPLQNILSVRTFHCTIFNQYEHSTAQYSVHVLTVRTFQHTIFTQQKHSGTKYSVSTNIPLQNILSVRTFPLHNIQSVRTFQCAIFSACPDSTNIPLHNIYSAKTFQHKIFCQYAHSTTRFTIACSGVTVGSSACPSASSMRFNVA